MEEVAIALLNPFPPPPGSVGAAAVRAGQPGPGICPVEHLCPGPGGHPARGTAANRHGVPHTAVVSRC